MLLNRPITGLLTLGLAIQNIQADEADRVTGWGCCIDHEDPCPFRALLVPPH